MVTGSRRPPGCSGGGGRCCQGVDRIDGFVRAAAPVAKSAELNMALASKGIYVSELSPWEVELESVFLELTGEAVDA